MPRTNPSERQPDIRARFDREKVARRYHDRFNHGWRLRTHWLEVAALDALLRRLGPCDLIVDAPCGSGRLAEALAPHCRLLLQLDASMLMLQFLLAQKRAAALSHCCLGDLAHLPLASGSVDCLLCHRFINHVPDAADRLAVLRELARVSRKHVVISSLGGGGLLRHVKRTIQTLAGRRRGESVPRDSLIAEAAQAGLDYADSQPIRRLLRTSEFLVFTAPLT